MATVPIRDPATGAVIGRRDTRTGDIEIDIDAPPRQNGGSRMNWAKYALPVAAALAGHAAGGRFRGWQAYAAAAAAGVLASLALAALEPSSGASASQTVAGQGGDAREP